MKNLGYSQNFLVNKKLVERKRFITNRIVKLQLL